MGGFKKPAAAPKKDLKKIYGVQMPSTLTKKNDDFAAELQEIQEFSTEVPKGNSQFLGLNYRQANLQEDEYEAIFNKVFKKHANLDEEPEEEPKSKESNRMSMKISGFDDEEYDPSKDESRI